VPVGNVLVCDTRGDIEHDDTALAVDVVTISETTELLLTSSVPHVEDDLAEVLMCLLVFFLSLLPCPISATYGGETERVNFDTERRDVLLLELSSQVTLDESGLGENQELANIIPSLLLRAHSRRDWTDSFYIVIEA